MSDVKTITNLKLGCYWNQKILAGSKDSYSHY